MSGERACAYVWIGSQRGGVWKCLAHDGYTTQPECECVDRPPENGIYTLFAFLRSRCAEMEEAIGIYIATLDGYRQRAQEEGIPLAEYEYARFAELALPVFEAERVLRVLAHTESEDRNG